MQTETDCTCPKCAYAWASRLPKGQKPKRCPRCGKWLDGKARSVEAIMQEQVAAMPEQKSEVSV